MTIGEWIRRAREQLYQAGCPDPEIDARWIAEDILDMDRSELVFESGRALENDRAERLEACLHRRCTGEPVQYVLGSAYFMGLRFYVDKRVLIPRQDTETLVEALIVALAGYTAPKVLDLCTGSGAIGLSVKTLVPKAEVTISDVSRDALDVARYNAHELNAEVEVCHGDLFGAVGKDRYDVIASNPPYIPRIDLAQLQREVLREPQLALDGGSDGLDFYRRIAGEAGDHLLPGGSVYLEVGYSQAESVRQLLDNALSGAQTGIINDLNGIGRVVWAKLPG